MSVPSGLLPSVLHNEEYATDCRKANLQHLGKVLSKSAMIRFKYRSTSVQQCFVPVYPAPSALQDYSVRLAATRKEQALLP